MNFLAHAYLSFNDPNLLLGNLVADFVKGKQIELLPADIRQGIILHREIDAFTDNHEITRQTKLLFRERAGRYDSSFLDVAYDYFVATDKDVIPNEGWQMFSQNCYNIIDARLDEMPNTFQRLYSYMKKENWLYNYQNRWFIEKSFSRLTQRAKFLENDANIYLSFEEHFDELQIAYNAFFPDLKQHIEEIIG